MYIRKDAILEVSKKLSEGEVDFVVATGDKDSDGERINVDGISLTDYKKNPVVTWAHETFNLPIGRSERVWKEDGKLMARVKFYLKDEFPRKVYNYIVDGFLKGASIGGMVDEWGEDGTTIERMTMKEFGVVTLGSNPKALVAEKKLSNKKEVKSELNTLAKVYARELFTKYDIGTLRKNIKNLETLVAALKEVALSQPDREKAEQIRVVLRQAQAVDKQTESIIKLVKLKKENRNG